MVDDRHPTPQQLEQPSVDSALAAHLESCASCRVDRRQLLALVGPSGAQEAPGGSEALDALRHTLASLGDSLEVSWRSARSANSRGGSSSGGEPSADQDVQLAEGTRVGVYTVEGLLGRGGMASVYLVRHRDLHTRHALKLVRAAGASLHQRLRREGRLQARLRHPNVLHVTEVLVVNGAPALVLELARGPSLAALLRDERLSLTDVDACANQVLAGVAAAHAIGLVHRDLKPANVLLDVDEASGTLAARVSDFGLVKVLERDVGTVRTRSGAVLGTPSYMAPEQLRDASRADQRSDVFALGAVLFELLTGYRCFGGTDFVDVVARVAAGRAPALDQLRRGTPERMVAAIAAALEVDPARRPEDAAALARMWNAEAAPVTDWRNPTLARRAAAMVVVRRLPAATGEAPVLSTEVGERTARVAPHGLGPEEGPFVGRLAALADLDAVVQPGRLVTVLGPGGMGKTRLVQRLAWTRAGRFHGGVWFVDAAGARSELEFATAAARVLDVPPSDDLTERLGRVLAHKGRALLVVDNLEQGVEAAARVLGAWRVAAPELAVVGTSRVRLHAAGEQVLVLEPLLAEEGAALFVQRARAARPGLELGDDDLVAIARLVEALDGLPLAIELAAARLRLVALPALVQRLTDRFRLLAGGRDRHATLAAVIEDSWSLLAPWEQAALAQCTVFDGGFTLEAVEATIDLSAWPGAPWPMDVVQALLDASLVHQRADGTDPARAPRLFLLHSVREFAAARLEPAQRAAAELGHGRWFAAWGDAERLGRSRGVAQRAALFQEVDNLVAACRRATARGDVAVARGSLLAAYDVLRVRGPVALAAELARGVAGLAGASDADRFAALGVLGDALNVLGAYADSLAVREAALALAREPSERAVALGDLGTAWIAVGRRVDAAAPLQEALELSDAVGDARVAAQAHADLAQLAFEDARLDDAFDSLERALDAARRADDPLLLAKLLGHRGLIQEMRGHEADSEQSYEASLDAAARAGDRRQEAIALSGLATRRILAGEPTDSIPMFRRARQIAADVGDAQRFGSATSDLAWALADAGRLEQALATYDAVVQHWSRLGVDGHLAIALGNRATVDAELGRVDRAREGAESALEIGRRTGHGVAQAAALVMLAELDRAAGDPHAALDRLAEAGPLAVAGNAHLYGTLLEATARAHRSRRDGAAAIEAAEAAVAHRSQTGSGEAPAWLLLAELLAWAGRGSEALAAASRALQLGTTPGMRGVAAAAQGGLLALRGARSATAASFALADPEVGRVRDRATVLAWRAVAASGEARDVLLDEAVALSADPVLRADVWDLVATVGAADVQAALSVKNDGP